MSACRIRRKVAAEVLGVKPGLSLGTPLSLELYAMQYEGSDKIGGCTYTKSLYKITEGIEPCRGKDPLSPKLLI